MSDVANLADLDRLYKTVADERLSPSAYPLFLRLQV
jgi:hypothetical protein